MIPNSNMRALLTTLAVIVSMLFAILFCGWLISQREVRTVRPYITYGRLLNLAAGCDQYKSKYGVWPDSLITLRAYRGDLNDAATDMWGRQVILVPYSASLGYGEIISYGSDGKPGGVGADRDLEVRFPTGSNSNWNSQMGVGLARPSLPP
jgi:hypothetical protein